MEELSLCVCCSVNTWPQQNWRACFEVFDPVPDTSYVHPCILSTILPILLLWKPSLPVLLGSSSPQLHHVPLAFCPLASLMPRYWVSLRRFSHSGSCAYLEVWEKCTLGHPLTSGGIGNCFFLTLSYSLNPKMDCIVWYLDGAHFSLFNKPTWMMLLEILDTKDTLFQDLAQCLPHSSYFINWLLREEWKEHK